MLHVVTDCLDQWQVPVYQCWWSCLIDSGFRPHHLIPATIWWYRGPLCYSEHLILSLLCIHCSLPVPVNEFKTLHIRLIGNYTAVSVFTSFVKWAGIFQFICCNIYKLFNPCTHAPSPQLGMFFYLVLLSPISQKIFLIIIFVFKSYY